VTEHLRAEGWDVDVVEDNPRGSVYEARAATVAALGARVVEAPSEAELVQLVAAADLVVPSPLVRPEHPALRAATRAGVPVHSEIDLAAQRTTAEIVAVTGTNGKTTVTEMIAAMLVASGRHAAAVGNIGRPLVEAVDDDVEILVAEVSSFQLALSTSFRPRVAVLLAITPDHLDWHGGWEPYVAAKARVSALQSGDDLLVYDGDDPAATRVAAGAPARTVAVSNDSARFGAFRPLEGDLVTPDGAPFASLAMLRRALRHDVKNALASAAAALEVGATLAGVRETLARYETLPHRVALVGEARGVQWYDDSKATNPDATLHAVGSFESVVLIAGGRNKGLDLSVLAGAAAHVRAVVALGEAAPEVHQAFEGKVPVAVAASMHEAVQHADTFAEAGDVVLLSPACASFDAYASYAERGDDFAAEVRRLLAKATR
jgi:UDP-N-acetylmuramoylalanine--D-glutamate ligase